MESSYRTLLMKVQRIRLPDNSFSWIVLDGQNLPIQPIQAFLRYLLNLEYSPNTIHNYACHLRLLWTFLEQIQLQWESLTLANLADFIGWLRCPVGNVIPLKGLKPQRSERTINTILAAVCCFYDYHERIGSVVSLKTDRVQFHPGQKYKPFLRHIKQGNPRQRKLLKLKEQTYLPKTLTQAQVRQLLNSCHQQRDQFLIWLLYETGMRIGQALGLRHEDIHSWDNEIEIIPRQNNSNGALAKTKQPYTIHVSRDLMFHYGQYLSTEYPANIDSDYVFVNVCRGCIGAPMTYPTVVALMRRLTRVTGIHVHTHLFRHSHATELIRSGWDLSLVQKRLGHASVQTTANTYVHLNDADLKQAYQTFLQQQEQSQ